MNHKKVVEEKLKEAISPYLGRKLTEELRKEIIETATAVLGELSDPVPISFSFTPHTDEKQDT